MKSKLTKGVEDPLDNSERMNCDQLAEYILKQLKPGVDNTLYFSFETANDGPGYYGALILELMDTKAIVVGRYGSGEFETFDLDIGEPGFVLYELIHFLKDYISSRAKDGCTEVEVEIKGGNGMNRVNVLAQKAQGSIFDYIEAAEHGGILNDIWIDGGLIMTECENSFHRLVAFFDLLHFNFTTGKTGQPPNYYYLQFEFTIWTAEKAGMDKTTPAR